jgi:hypothetical protein
MRAVVALIMRLWDLVAKGVNNKEKTKIREELEHEDSKSLNDRINNTIR